MPAGRVRPRKTPTPCAESHSPGAAQRSRSSADGSPPVPPRSPPTGYRRRSRSGAATCAASSIYPQPGRDSLDRGPLRFVLLLLSSLTQRPQRTLPELDWELLRHASSSDRGLHQGQDGSPSLEARLARRPSTACNRRRPDNCTPEASPGHGYALTPLRDLNSISSLSSVAAWLSSQACGGFRAPDWSDFRSLGELSHCPITVITITMMLTVAAIKCGPMPED